MNAQGYLTKKGSSNTLIVVYLRGGADGLNMVAPVDDDAYYRARPTISIGKKDAISLNGFFGLNPELAGLHRAYADGALAIVHGAGSEDSTRSHFEAQDRMEHGGNAGGGWLGRYLTHSPSFVAGPLSVVAIGKAQPMCLWGAPASVAMESFNQFSVGDTPPGFISELTKLYTLENDELASAARDALTAMEKVATLKADVYKPANGAAYPDDKFGTGLRQIAQLIKAGVGLEVATLDLDGWDSHFASATLMNPLMRRLSQGLSAFYTDLGKAMETTTVVVMTEFGRRVYQNASFGTDHGRGSVMFVLGGGVSGGKVYSDWVPLDSDQLEGPGDVPVTHNFRNVLAPILQRHSTLSDFKPVFPDFNLEPLPLYG